MEKKDSPFAAAVKHTALITCAATAVLVWLHHIHPTGFLLSAAITAIPGASSVLDGAIVSYSPAVKGRFLEIDPAILYEVGVVSEECARAMAKGAAKLFSADTCIAVTGNAGPSAGDPNVPVGTVFVAVYLFGETVAEKLTLSGDRETVRIAAAKAAIGLLYRCLQETFG